MPVGRGGILFAQFILPTHYFVTNNTPPLQQEKECSDENKLIRTLFSVKFIWASVEWKVYWLNSNEIKNPFYRQYGMRLANIHEQPWRCRLAETLAYAHATGDALALIDFSEWRGLAGENVCNIKNSIVP